MNEQIIVYYNKDKRHPNDYLVKRVLTQDGEDYSLSAFYMINGKLKIFPSKLKLSANKLNSYLLQCKKANFFDKIERQFMMEGIFND